MPRSTRAAHPRSPARPAVPYRIGTSGWIYAHWRGRYYPEKLPVKHWFNYYARQFDTVEINNTFYRLPEARCFDAWRAQAPPGFVYAVKASRYLTHMKKLRDPGEPVERLVARASHLAEHLGPILYQLPPGWRRDTSRLRDFCRQLPRGLIHVFEFRDPDWLHPDTFGVLHDAGMSLCIHDLLPRHPVEVSGPVAYLRFHGSGSKYGGSYSRQHLRRWSRKIEQFAAAGRTVYAYFNNDQQAFAVHNALTLKSLLGIEPPAPAQPRPRNA
jgi:uncharacterized protein YecE (DUF72 family)